MNPDTLKRYAAPVPRYTSYPTAPHFSEAVGIDTYRQWLRTLPHGEAISLYVHIPYCWQLCWYCGCAARGTTRYEPVRRYVDVLLREIDAVSSQFDGRQPVTHIHFGGGSPSVLEPADIDRIATALKGAFSLAPDAEFAIEIDPRRLDEERVAAFAAAGVNRVSVGVQDFTLAVQKAINRLQSFEDTRSAIEAFGARGITAINIDLVYGLPNQTRDSTEETIERVIELAPSRIALFGYAHLPSRIPNQRLIDESTLPNVTERFAQSNRAANMLMAAGYIRIGLDHFVRPDDPLAIGKVNRNFQGYTNDEAPALIGLGASSIGRLPQGYVQNTAAVDAYLRQVEATGFATARGHCLSMEDKARGFAIERLMCDLRFPATELRRRFGTAAEGILEEAATLLEVEPDGLIEPDDTTEGIFKVTEKGRLFVRTISSVFDQYLDPGAARHSAGA